VFAHSASGDDIYVHLALQSTSICIVLRLQGIAQPSNHGIVYTLHIILVRIHAFYGIFNSFFLPKGN